MHELGQVTLPFWDSVSTVTEQGQHQQVPPEDGLRVEERRQFQFLARGDAAENLRSDTLSTRPHYHLKFPLPHPTLSPLCFRV